MPPMSDPIPPVRVSLWRMALRLALLLVLAYGVHLLTNLAMDGVKLLPEQSQIAARTGLILAMLAIYALFIALPFVPGIEIGISLMMFRGAEVAPAVYVATVTGLMLAYLAGHYLPHATLHRFFADLRLRGACQLLDRVEPLDRDARLALLRARLPGRLGDWAVRFRYVSLALLLNLPGNAVLGGGGGICLVAGMSGLFSRRGMYLTVALAVAPVPVAVWIWGHTAVPTL